MLSFFLAVLKDPRGWGSFRQFYRIYRQVMYRAAYEVLEDEGAAEDAVQSALVAIAEQEAKLREMDPERLHCYAVVAARSKAIDLWRQRRRMQSSEEPEKLEEPAAEFPFRQAEGGGILAIIDSLPEQYATVLKLTGLGFRPAEIARMQKKKIQTVYKQLSRGRSLLKARMKEEGYEYEF